MNEAYLIGRLIFLVVVALCLLLRKNNDTVSK
jgi:hypothetical protein